LDKTKEIMEIMEITTERIRAARKALGHTQKQMGIELGYAESHAQVAISNLERNPYPNRIKGAVRKQLEIYLRRADTFERYRCAARCPRCGEWTTDTTGQQRGNGEILEMKCPCGHVWWTII